MAEQVDAWRGTPKAFLDAFKFALEFRKYELRWGTKDWLGDLADLGLTMQIAVKLVQEELAPEHTHRGPEFVVGDAHARKAGADTARSS